MSWIRKNKFFIPYPDPQLYRNLFLFLFNAAALLYLHKTKHCLRQQQ